MKRALLAALLLIAACSGPAPARAEPAVWKIEDADSTILIFGSFHLLPQGIDWRPQALDLALVQADDLWFEVPLDTAVSSQAQTDLMARGVLPAGESLSAMLSARGRADLAATAMRLGLPLATLDRLQPWYAETALSLAVYRQQGALPEEGVERQLAEAAPPTAKLRAFETTSQQIDLFASGPRAAQIASLEYSLRLFEDDPGYFNRLMASWLKGDTGALDREVLGELRKTDPEQYRTLIVARNRAWKPIIEERLKGSGRTVIVVGVGHLVGKDGLPAMLRADGIAVEGP